MWHSVRAVFSIQRRADLSPTHPSPLRLPLFLDAPLDCIDRLVSASPLGQRQLLLTKGDNNPVDDIDLYQGLEWLERRHIVGKVRGYVLASNSTIPFLGLLLPISTDVDGTLFTDSCHTSDMSPLPW